MNVTADSRDTLVIRAFFSVLLLVTLHSVYNYFESVRGFSYPYDTFLSDPNDRFADHTKAILSFPFRKHLDPSDWPELFKDYYFHNTYEGVEGLQKGAATNVGGLPLRTLIGLLWSIIFKHTGPVIELCIAAFTYVALAFRATGSITKKWAPRLAMFGLLLISYPGLMVFDRGNFDAGFASLCVLLFFISLAKGRDRTAFLSLAVAINMHPNLAVLGLMVLCQYWQDKRRMLLFVFRLGEAAIAIFFASLLLAHAMFPDYSLKHLLQGLTIYNTVYAMGSAGLEHGSSLAGMLKYFSLNYDNIHFLNYVLLAEVSGALLFLAAKGKVTFNECAYLCIIYSMLFSEVLADYNLIVLAIPFILAYYTGHPLTQPEDNPLYKPNKCLFVLTVLLLAPKNYFFIDSGHVSYQTVINPLLMLGVVAVLHMNILSRLKIQ